jgi:hypothetical protein
LQSIGVSRTRQQSWVGRHTHHETQGRSAPGVIKAGGVEEQCHPHLPSTGMPPASDIGLAQS